MSIFRHLFAAPQPHGLDPAAPGSTAPGGPDDPETATVRAVVARIGTLPPERARFVACTAYVLTRAANADSDVSPVEAAFVEHVLREQGGLDAAEAVLVVETAKLQALAVGGTDDFIVTREFRRVATAEERLAVLRACFTVSAADGSISAPESATINEIALELDIEPADLARLRTEYTALFAAVQEMRADAAAATGPMAPGGPNAPGGPTAG